MIPIASPSFGPEEEAAVIDVMRSGVYAQGERVRRLEACFASVSGARYAVATSNGSAALQLALLAHGIGPGDEVITTPLTFIASANAIVHTGARPVFADVDETLNLAPASVEALITRATRAILPVHLHGNPAALHRFRSLCDRHGLVLVQDACQAVGATLGGLPLGAFGTACYSLYATKNITTGEGGMIVTDDAEVARTAASLRHQGYAEGAPYLHDRIGFNHRLTELQAAIGLVQLQKLPALTAARRENAAFYDAAVSQLDGLSVPARLPDAEPVFHQYVVRVDDGGQSRERVRAELERAGVGTGVHYPVPVHLQPAYRGLVSATCPNAERAAADMISLPVHPGVGRADRERVAAALGEAVGVATA